GLVARDATNERHRRDLERDDEHDRQRGEKEEWRAHGHAWLECTLFRSDVLGSAAREHDEQREADDPEPDPRDGQRPREGVAEHEVGGGLPWVHDGIAELSGRRARRAPCAIVFPYLPRIVHVSPRECTVDDAV